MCLDHLWSEPGGSGGAARRVFLARDTVGQQAIYLLQGATLAIIKMERTNDGSGKVIFGAARRVPAVDAAPVAELDMVVVLETTDTLALYSGATRVSKVLVPSGPTLQTIALSQEISALALDSQPATPRALPKPRTPPHLDLASAPATPLNTKRSSLLTSSRPPSAQLPSFGNDSCLGAPSPVAGGGGGVVVGLRDPLGRGVTLTYSTGRLLRVLLPVVGSPLVCAALAAVKLLLPRDLALALHSAWYSARHAPGPPPSPPKEWTMFSHCLLSLAGYQVDLLDLSATSRHNSSTGEAAAPSKRCRPAEGGCDSDWRALLASAHHTEVGDSLSRLLALDHPVLEDGEPEEARESGEVSSSAPLFPYIPAILWSLHLLYEELKLDLGQAPQLPLLAGLLSRVAADLQLPHYRHHYWQDLPQAALSPRDTRASQLAPALLSRLAPAPHMTPRPPSIVDHLTRLACSQVKPNPTHVIGGGFWRVVLYRKVGKAVRGW